MAIDRLTVLQGDCRETMKGLADRSVHCVVTSPPYYALRDYGTARWEGGNKECDHVRSRALKRDTKGGMLPAGEGTRGTQSSTSSSVVLYKESCAKCGARRIDSQLGLETRPDCLGWATGEKCGECFICQLVAVFDEVWRVLRDDGVAWVNLGDSYASGEIGRHDSAQGRSINEKQISAKFERRQSAKIKTGLKPKDLVMIPARFALAMQAAGWTLRADIVWAKGVSFCPQYSGSVMPESVTDRVTKSHEYLYMLTKGAGYFYDKEAVKESNASQEQLEHNLKYAGEYASTNGNAHHKQPGNVNSAGIHSRPGTAGRNLRSVWVINPQPFSGAHFATFPTELVRPCILASTSARGCCSECGAQWQRIVERSGGTIGKSWHSHADDLGKGAGQDGAARVAKMTDGTYQVKTLGWKPSCDCEADVVPATVLDPFAGSGTVGAVALALGRKSILCELSPEYVRLIEDRCQVTYGLPF